MRRALLSVSDKAGIVEFARELSGRGWTLLSTGGTARVLRDAGLEVVEVSEITGHPELMEGRVKTLHPAVHAGLLARPEHPEDAESLAALGYAPIDLVAVNLYPFRETVAREGVELAEAVENIDVGGPAMLRAAAKNHERVWVVVDPVDHARVLAGLDAADADARGVRRELAAKAFAHTAAYDEAVAAYLTELSASREGASAEEPAPTDSPLPGEIRLELRRVQGLRYGENPHQAGALYADSVPGRGLTALRQLHGKELSFNNLLDVDAALFAVAAWAGEELSACAIVKHTTPCGIAVGADAAEAYRKALMTDPTSAFGSVIAFNTPVSEQASVLLRGLFVEAIAAPAFAPRALEILRDRKNLRLLEVPELGAAPGDLDFKRVRGGFVVQTRLPLRFPEDAWRVVTEREPTEEEWNDLRFAWRAVATVKSNAILLARDGMAVGIGAGQMSRVDASRLAVLKAGDNGFDLQGAVLASDAFFPFRDGVDAAAQAGIRAVIQPGGSVRDPEVITAANEHGVAMVLTGTRLFRH